MLRIECPDCGVRDESEFAYGGEAHLERPALAATDAEWTAYLFVRENPLGVHAERWRHARGCGQWFHVLRHTLTHHVVAVYPMGAARPAVDDEATEAGA
jgi:heterotetrameric sarcosine oxidase delta subunit